MAEIVNTLTNLWFMYLAFVGIVSCRKYGHDTIFLVAFIGYLLVGSGSFLFHASLKCMLAFSDVLSPKLSSSDKDTWLSNRSNAACG